MQEIGLFTTKKEASQVMSKADLGPEDILNKIETLYTSQMNEDSWTPAAAKVDSTAPPSQKFRQNKAYNAVGTSLRSNGASHFIKTPQGHKKKGNGGRKGKYNKGQRHDSTKDKVSMEPSRPR